ncbi:MAG: aryl-sulfate sulfotransferase [Brevinema sp.]
MIIFRLLVILLFISCQKIPFDSIPNSVLLTNSTPYVTINPYGIAPLSAQLHLAKAVDDLTITVKGQDGVDSDISYTWNKSSNTIFPILGMYFDSTNTIILSSKGKEDKILNIVITNKQSEYIKDISILTNNRKNISERRNFLTFLNPVGVLKDLFAIDNYGKIRWYLQSTNELHAMKFFQTNNEVHFSILDSVIPQILTYSMTGKLINVLKGPKINKYNTKDAKKRFHHDFYIRNNGNILVLDKSRYGVEDVIIEIDPKGKVLKEILIGNWIRKTVNGSSNDNTGLEQFIFDSEQNPFDEYRAASAYPGMPNHKNAIDWAHINALSFDEDSQTLFLSFRQHGVFAFDYQKEELKWIFIRDKYTIPTANLSFYNLPDNVQFVHQIPKLQPYIINNGPDHSHAITWLSNNQWMVFDNSGNDGEFPKEGSRLMVFSIDETNKKADILWEYRHKDTNNSLIYSQIVSDIDKTAFNSYIGTFGTKTPYVIAEINENKNTIFDVRINLRGSNEENDSDVSLPIACPTTRLLQNGIVLYRSEYQSIYPSPYQSID